MKNQINQLASDPRRFVRKKLEKHRQIQQLSTSLYLKYCSLTGCFHVLPDFLIIGFVKCGTTSLYQYLIKHPNVISAKGKEIDYFDRLYKNGTNWYKNSFPLELKKYFLKNIFNKEFLTGEATPRYIEHPHTLQRIKTLIPNSKFVVLLRNPIDRAFSHYKMNLGKGREKRSFETVLLLEVDLYNQHCLPWNSFLGMSFYNQALIRYNKLFEKILVLKFEELTTSPNEALKKVERFLEITPFAGIEVTHKNASKTLRFQKVFYFLNQLGLKDYFSKSFSSKFKQWLFGKVSKKDKLELKLTPETASKIKAIFNKESR